VSIMVWVTYASFFSNLKPFFAKWTFINVLFWKIQNTFGKNDSLHSLRRPPYQSYAAYLYALCGGAPLLDDETIMLTSFNIWRISYWLLTDLVLHRLVHTIDIFNSDDIIVSFFIIKKWTFIYASKVSSQIFLGHLYMWALLDVAFFCKLL